ncbi:MAG: T9SS type A sorting domain-containing protein, partial [Bacteroidales bacterium]|nr:T9SS type A sorting domain-containing protein [Bacteroidales bacterium]
SSLYGGRVAQRPNMRLNGHVLGTGQLHNSPTDYPAPYGNWYWAARHQMLIRAAELSAAGVPIGNITSLAFDVVSTDPNTTYDYIDISMKLVTSEEVTSEFVPVDTNNFLHTNFKISGSGEAIYLYSPGQVLLSELFVDCGDLDNSSGRFPDASENIFLFQNGTPSATNNQSTTYSGYLLAPSFSVPSGFYDEPFGVTITNPNPGSTSIHYTIDGSEPSILSPLYNGQPINILYSVVLKARAFAWGILPSQNTISSYLFGVNHTTPVVSVITDQVNLYGEKGIFDNWWTDWEKTAYVEYFDSTQNMIFSQRTGMQIDGGWGGARYHPQHSFRLELDDGVLGDGSIDYPLIPGRPERTKYSKFYLRNGSNQYLAFPYKDASQVTAMGNGTNNYYSAWRPVSVYINGYYFGLYELREKIDAEYFETLEGADNDEMDLLSLSAWYGFVLRALEGSADEFIEDYIAFAFLDPADTTYWKDADAYFDLTFYTDYIIGESWMANTDWPGNNIKIYRSDKTNYRWRFCLIDLELALAPNSWTDCYYDHIRYMLDYDPNNPYINIWKRSIQNEKYLHYFINRYADVMNTAYLFENISAIENRMFTQTVIEMPKEYARWGDPNHIPEQMNAFIDNHNTFQSQLYERTTQVRNHIQSNFNLPNQVDLTLNVYPEGAGKIHISTITPETYPWQGVYFNGVPIQIQAIANEGFNFLHWGANDLISDTLDAVFLDILNTEEISFDAYFEEIATGVSSDKEPTRFLIYPNPAQDILFVQGEIGAKDAHYQIIDMQGRTVMEGDLTGGNVNHAITLGSIPPSVYLLRVTDQEGEEYKSRFVKTLKK